MDYKIGLIASIGLGLWLAWWTFQRMKPKPFLCPKCGGILDSDPNFYRWTVKHTCLECGAWFETPKTGHR